MRWHIGIQSEDEGQFVDCPIELKDRSDSLSGWETYTGRPDSLIYAKTRTVAPRSWRVSMKASVPGHVASYGRKTRAAVSLSAKAKGP